MATALSRDFDARVLDLHGKPVREGLSIEAAERVFARLMRELPDEDAETVGKILAEEQGAELTLGAASASALITGYKDDGDRSEKTVVERLELALRLAKGGVQEISPTERDLVKRLVIKRYAGALIPGRCAQMLETETKK